MNVIWFTTYDGYCIGIVKDNNGGFRIGIGLGKNETEDIERIKKLGDKFYPQLFKEKD